MSNLDNAVQGVVVDAEIMASLPDESTASAVDIAVQEVIGAAEIWRATVASLTDESAATTTDGICVQSPEIIQHKYDIRHIFTSIL